MDTGAGASWALGDGVGGLRRGLPLGLAARDPAHPESSKCVTPRPPQTFSWLHKPRLLFQLTFYYFPSLADVVIPPFTSPCLFTLTVIL